MRAVIADVDPCLVWVIDPIWQLGGKTMVREKAAVAGYSIANEGTADAAQYKTAGEVRGRVGVSPGVAV